MAKFKKLFLSAAMLLGICVIGGGLTTHADDGDQEPAELTENFSFVEEFNYNSDGVGEPGKDNEYNIFSAQYTNTNEDGALSLEKKGEYDALKLVAARIDSSQNILAVAFRDQGKPIYDNEENPNAIIKIRYLSDNQGGNNIDFCLMFNKDELDENCPDNQCRYQFRIRGGNNRDLQQGRYPSESVQAVSTANGKFTEKVWHELTFILEDNGDLESDGTSPDKIYAYLDDEFLMERTFHNNDNYHGKLTQFYYYTQCNSAYDRRTYIDYIKVGPYNKAVATEPEISTVKVNLPFDLNPLVVGENENYLPSLSKYTVDFSVNEEQLVATTQDGVTSYTLNDEVVLTYQNGKYVASKTIANLKATFNFADHSLDPMSVTFDIEENNEPIPVTDIQTNPVVRNNTITLGVEEEYDLDKLFAAYPEGADETTLAYEVVSGNDVVSIEDGVLKGLSVGTATIKVSATDESGVEKEVTVNVSSGAYASLNDYALEDAWETANHTASGFTSVAYSNKTYAQISVQEDSVFGNVICIAGNGGKDSSGAHLDKYVPVSELSANKNYKLTAWIKLNPEAAEKTSGTSLDLKIFAYYYENGRYSYGEQGSAYGNQVRTFKADLVNGWVYVESPAVNLDTNAIGHAFEGFKLELGLWNAEAGVNAYITHLALVEVEEDVNAVDWNLVDDNNHALDTTNNLTIQANSTYQINAVSIPSAGTISPTFASGDETIATVDENGLVTILNQIGTVTITVTVGGASKEITFDVKKSAESITLDSETINIILHSFDPRRGVWNITVTPADSTSELVATVENEDVCTATIVDNKLYISNPVLGSTRVTISAVDNPSASFTVVVNVKEYTVTYDVQGHGAAQESVENVLALPAELPTLEAEGYVFGGWYLDAECTTIAEAGKEITEDTTLYAKWTKTFTITYDVLGHGTAPESVTNAVALPATLPSVSVEGYVFEAWYLDAEFTTMAEAGKEITADTTLYAKWVVKEADKFSVVYNAQGHGTAPANAVNVTALPATLPTITAEGYVFGGWYLDADCTQKATEGAAITADTTLYAKWTQVFTVTYDVQGHGTAQTPVVNVTALPEKLPTLEAEGYVFGGWYLDADCTQKATEGAAITANTTLYAKWTAEAVEPVTYTITYNVQGHGTAPAEAKGTKLPDALPTLTATGYTFEGWYLDADCTQKAEAGKEITADTTLYAKWTEKAVVTPTPTPETPEKTGLPGGAIAGIVIAVVVVLGAAGGAAFFFIKKKQAPKAVENKEETENTEDKE